MKTINKIIYNKIFLYATFTIVAFSFIFTNMFLIGGGKYTLEQTWHVLKDPTVVKAVPELDISFDQFRELSFGVWAAYATCVAAAGLTITGLVTQSLTKNPLADASTLGYIQAGIFMLLVALSFQWTTYYLKFFAVIIGAALASLLLLGIITFSKNHTSVSKVILCGLAIGIIFKTFSFLIRTNDKFLTSVSYQYALGGSDAVVTSIGTDKWNTLYVSTGLIAGAIIIFAFISRWLTILELGDHKAMQLGVKVKTTKALSIVVLIISVPAAVIIAGNLAFLGLFAVHITRHMFRTRNYSMLLVPSILVGIIIASFGLFLTTFIPSINSGLWMAFIGAPYIIWAGFRGLR